LLARSLLVALGFGQQFQQRQSLPPTTPAEILWQLAAYPSHAAGTLILTDQIPDLAFN
jgi:hypothetical protein